MWHVLISQGVLSKLHHFSEVSWRDVGMKRALQDLPKRVPRNWYRPSSRKCVLPLHKVSTLDEQATPGGVEQWLVG